MYFYKAGKCVKKIKSIHENLKNHSQNRHHFIVCCIKMIKIKNKKAYNMPRSRNQYLFAQQPWFDRSKMLIWNINCKEFLLYVISWLYKSHDVRSEAMSACHVYRKLLNHSITTWKQHLTVIHRQNPKMENILFLAFVICVCLKRFRISVQVFPTFVEKTRHIVRFRLFLPAFIRMKIDFTFTCNFSFMVY